MSLPLAPTIGMRVIATRDACAHTKNGRIDHLPGVAPVAIVAFDCGCRAYVPLRRLDPEPTPGGTCGLCRRPEWPVGSGFCFKHHKTAAGTAAASPTPVRTPGVGREQPFDSQVRPGHAGTSAPQPRGGRAAIDGRGTKAADTPLNRPASKPPLRGEHAAGRMAGRGTGVPRPAPAGGGSGDRRRLRVVAGGAAHGEPPVAVRARRALAAARGTRGRPTRWPTREDCIAAAHHYYRCRGRWPLMTDWDRETEENPVSGRVVKLFGGWIPFAAAAGFESRHRKDWTREQLVAAFQRFAQEEGRSPSASILDTRARPDYMPSTNTAITLFGSLTAAIAASGLPQNPVGRPKKAAA